MDISITRIVVDGCNVKPRQTDNKKVARRRLHNGLASANRDAEDKVTFVLTPGGFVSSPFPQDYDGDRGWKSRETDFDQLVNAAQEAVTEVLTAKVLAVARRRARFLTLGVDLAGRGGKGTEHNCTPSCPGSCTHAELVAIVDTSSGRSVHWTGKSYPVTQKTPPRSQEHSLVQAPIKSHFFRSDGVKALVLGCHDLTMFNPRNCSNIRHASLLERRSTMRTLAKKFRPNVVLHHPHSTECTRTWCHGWGGVRRDLLPGTWASGIAYCGYEPRSPLDRVLSTTRHGSVSDVVVDGY